MSTMVSQAAPINEAIAVIKVNPIAAFVGVEAARHLRA